MAAKVQMVENGYEQYLRLVEMSSPVSPELRSGASLPRALGEIALFANIPDNPAVVYPGSGTHVDVAEFFGAGSVTHVDPNALACRALKNFGYRAVESRLEDFMPENPFDILVAINTPIAPSTEIIKNVLAPKGLILADNNTDWAADLYEMEGIKLKGGIVTDFRVEDSEWRTHREIPEDTPKIVQAGLAAVRKVQLTGTSENLRLGMLGLHKDKDSRLNHTNALYVFEKQSTSTD